MFCVFQLHLFLFSSGLFLVVLDCTSVGSFRVHLLHVVQRLYASRNGGREQPAETLGRAEICVVFANTTEPTRSGGDISHPASGE